MRRFWWATLAIMVIVMAGPSSARAAAPVAGHVRLAIASAAHDADYSQTPARDGFVILNEWERNRMLSLKAANPSLKVLLYQNLSAMAARDSSGNVNTGVTTQEADSSWYLLNTGGQRFSFWGYDWIYAADIGNAAYQQRWADNVLAKLRSGGWDGVFMDDTNPTIKYHYEPSQVAKYPDDARYGAATRSAVAAIGPRIRAAGKLVIPNFGAWREYRSVVDDWLQFVDGGMEEMLGKWSNDPGQGYLTGADWSLQLGEIKAAESAGKTFLGITHGTGTDAAAARYGWATVLLAAQGRSSFALADDYASQHWFPEYDYDLGGALGAEAADATGVHRRAFARGLVLVNPTLSTVAVGFGGPYSGSGLSGATQAVMGPHSALVLTADGGVTPVAPVPPVSTPAPGASAPTSPAPTPADPAEQKTTSPARVSARAATLRAAGSVTARVRCPEGGRACRREVRVLLPLTRAKPVVTGHRTVTVAAGHVRRVSVKLDARGRRALAGGGSLLIRVR